MGLPLRPTGVSLNLTDYSLVRRVLYAANRMVSHDGLSSKGLQRLVYYAVPSTCARLFDLSPMSELTDQRCARVHYIPHARGNAQRDWRPKCSPWLRPRTLLRPHDRGLFIRFAYGGSSGRARALPVLHGEHRYANPFEPPPLHLRHP